MKDLSIKQAIDFLTWVVGFYHQDQKKREHKLQEVNQCPQYYFPLSQQYQLIPGGFGLIANPYKYSCQYQATLQEDCTLSALFTVILISPQAKNQTEPPIYLQDFK